jgi:hypothetical protein
MNRVQFQKGRSMTEFNALYGNEDACRAAGDAHAGHTACPRCQHGTCRRFERAGQIQLECTACGCQTSLINGTLFQATKLPLRLWFLAIYLLSAAKTKLSALELRRHLENVWTSPSRTCQPTPCPAHVRLLLRRIQHLRAGFPGRPYLAGGTFE